MNYTDTIINIFYTKKTDVTLTDEIEYLKKSAKVVEILTGKKQKWHFTGETKKSALKYEFFDESGIADFAIKKMEKEYIKNKPIINESIWNGMPDNEASSISHFMMSLVDLKKASVKIDIIGEQSTWSKMVDSLLLLVNAEWDSWVVVETNGYSFYDYNVFPDRLYVGWMLYIPHKVLSELIPEVARVVPVIDEEGKQKGTIIVSTEEVFDGSKKEHIEKANDIEIRLLDLGLLPLMTEL